MPEARVSPRERLVLTAIIEIYIATGEPVASQAVARLFADREGLSSATVRNVMATLGDADCWSSRIPRRGGFRRRRRFAITWSRLRSRARGLGSASNRAGSRSGVKPAALDAERGAARAD